VEGAGTSGCGAKNRNGGAPGAGFFGEREGSQADASQGHELRHVACCGESGQQAEELSCRGDVRQV
jgi:hypothetical protein